MDRASIEALSGLPRASLLDLTLCTWRLKPKECVDIAQHIPKGYTSLLLPLQLAGVKAAVEQRRAKLKMPRLDVECGISLERHVSESKSEFEDW